MPKNQWDEHHVLFQKRAWRRDQYGRTLRADDGLIVPIDREVHTELHRDPELQNGVPLLGRSAMQLVRSAYRRQPSYTQSIDRLLVLINRTQDPARELVTHLIDASWIIYVKVSGWLNLIKGLCLCILLSNKVGRYCMESKLTNNIKNDKINNKGMYYEN